MSTTRVSLKPTPGFCFKTTALQPALLHVTPAVSAGPNALEPRTAAIPVPLNRKVFINIAWDSQVPPPPEGNEEAIQSAMHGQDDENLNPDAWFVPVIVSEPREDSDKSGNPSLVFDCVYHTSIKSRTLRDPAFKIFVQELALQRIEAQTSLVLSRQISTPNIASKGKLLPRTVLIPSSIRTPATPPQRPLIEELPSANSKPESSTKGILKKTAATPVTSTPNTTKADPTWRWSKNPNGSLEITITIPSLTRASIPSTILEIEPRRISITVPGRAEPSLDIDLSVSDAEMVATSGAAPDGGLMLKRERALDVDGASAEWRVAEGVLVVVA
ncbi:PIH1 domain-containing protein 1 [Favolaschia claudopus]|uniref:PIH1 domain-containing protein 1 n=1 Tax=Favolaschia claudopus TaxID=2862362 RepID=A0AAW0DQZ6_9AGAR